MANRNTIHNNVLPILKLALVEAFADENLLPVLKPQLQDVKEGLLSTFDEFKVVFCSMESNIVAD